MSEMRETQRINPDLNHDCDRIHLEDYQLEEVILPATKREPARKAIRIRIQGRNLSAVAQPLIASVGTIQVRYMRIAPDERSLEGILLKEPQAGSFVEVILGDQDAARHPTPVDPTKIKRV